MNRQLDQEESLSVVTDLRQLKYLPEAYPFLMIMDALASDIQEEAVYPAMLCADDTELVAESGLEVQSILEVAKTGLKFCRTKTEYMFTIWFYFIGPSS